MTRRFRRVIGAMFLLLMALPLAAPLQLLDLRDLFGIQVHRSTTPAPESITTPAISEVSSENSGVPLVAPVASFGALVSSSPALLSARASLAFASRLSFPAPLTQRTVLRI